jgi:vancomycin resistance protein VanJ
VIEPTPDETPAVRPRRRRLVKAVRILSLLDLVIVALAVGVLWIVSERTWWGTLLTFLPRHPFLVAPILLLLVSLFADRRMIVVNLASLVLAAGPLMGARIPLSIVAGNETPEHNLRIVSCNVQCFEPDFESVLREITSLSPDVIAFQEAVGEAALLPRYFPGWQILREGEYLIGSRYPLHRVGLCDTGVFPHHPSALSVRIDAPQGSFVLHDLHLTTPRYGFLKLTVHSVFDGSGPRYVDRYTERRQLEALRASDYVNQTEVKGDNGQVLPTLIAGDFNTPSISCLYEAAWSRFANAFDAVGFGFGYTAPCTNHRHWLDDVPWVRIDHILADRNWTVSACGIGHSKGSDHRLIWSTVSLRR